MCSIWHSLRKPASLPNNGSSRQDTPGLVSFDQVNTPSAVKCLTFGASAGPSRQFATGDFDGKLEIRLVTLSGSLPGRMALLTMSDDAGQRYREIG
jgi:hypothetical protein